MDCAPDDDRIIVVAMMGISAQSSPLLTLPFMPYWVFCKILHLILLLELYLILLLILLLILIILVLYISLSLPLCFSFYDIYWFFLARCFEFGQIVQLVDCMPNDLKIVGSDLDSAPNTFLFKSAKMILFIYLLIYIVASIREFFK